MSWVFVQTLLINVMNGGSRDFFLASWCKFGIRIQTSEKYFGSDEEYYSIIIKRGNCNFPTYYFLIAIFQHNLLFSKRLLTTHLFFFLHLLYSN